MKKQVPTAVVTGEAVPQQNDEKKGPILLDTLELSVLVHMVAASHDKATAEEKALLAQTNMTYPAAVLESLESKTLIEKNDKGEYVPTPWGIRWSLGARSFGYNFTAIFSKLNLGALHSAFFAMATELTKRHKDARIYYRDKEGNPSKFWARFDEAVADCDQCLEASDDNTTAEE
jgi:hypothetical protein